MDFAFKNKNTFLYWGIVNFPPSLVKNAESTEFLKHITTHLVENLILIQKIILTVIGVK